MNLYVALFIIILIVVLLMVYFNSEEMVSVGGFKYKVRPIEAKYIASRLHQMNETAIEIIELIRRRLEAHESGEESMGTYQYSKLKEMYSLLRNNYNPDGLQETRYNILKPNRTSYTYGKGKILSICLEYKGKEEPWVVLLLVLIHEMSHMATTSRNHTPEFWETYRIMMNVVSGSDIVKNISLPAKGKMYCGQVYISRKELSKLKKR